MNKYLKLYESHSQYVEPDVKPNVSYCRQENEVHYNLLDYSKEYLTFDIIEGGTIVWKTSHASAPTTTISYSINNSTWAEITSSVSGVSLNVTAGDRIRFKGSNNQYGSTTLSYYNTFNSSTAKFDVKGNIMSLLNSDSFINVTTISSSYTFNHLFDAVHIINAKNLILPATTLAQYCYRGMFYNCIYLVTAPELPAPTLTAECYSEMFYGCTSLINAPELPATTLAISCYAGMFDGCTNLVNAPELPATYIAGYAYNSMFKNCTSLVTAPSLPSTRFGQAPYVSMFEGCTSLVNAPELPKTTLSSLSDRLCYVSMFKNCTSLVNAPDLPATVLGESSYSGMFEGCTSLVVAPDLPATNLTSNCYKNMFSGCTSLNSITCLATDISASNCTQNWVSGVATNGTFTKAPSMDSWTTGVNGIPTGWTVETASE